MDNDADLDVINMTTLISFEPRNHHVNYLKRVKGHPGCIKH